MEIDAFIPAHPKDFPILIHSIRSILDFVTPRVRSVTVMANVLSQDLEQILKSTGSQFLQEDAVIPDLKRADVPVISYGGEDRSGWYFQQFLKWGIAGHSATKNYLVVDADTLFIAHTPFFHNKQTLHYRTGQHHLPYFRTYENLFGYRPDRKNSFIANYMVLNSDMVGELISTIERRHRGRWFNCILEKIDRDTMSSFSEYETYGYYLSRFHPTAFSSRKCATLNLYSPFFPFHDLLMRLARARFHSIAYHNYRR